MLISSLLLLLDKSTRLVASRGSFYILIIIIYWWYIIIIVKKIRNINWYVFYTYHKSQRPNIAARHNSFITQSSNIMDYRRVHPILFERRKFTRMLLKKTIFITYLCKFIFCYGRFNGQSQMQLESFLGQTSVLPIFDAGIMKAVDR